MGRWCLWLLCWSLPLHATTLNFCYEDKQLRPYYFGNSNEVPADHPGATIEHLQQITDSLHIKLNLVRLPWKRCLAQLHQGTIDAVIASHSAEREQYAVYPTKEGKPDPSRAFAEHETCLVVRPGNNWFWDGQKFQGIDKVVIARPLGYAPLKTSDDSKISIHYTLSGTQDLDLLEAGRVNAITTLCTIAGENAVTPSLQGRKLEVVYPALYRNTGYLVFSKAFYQLRPNLSRQVWDALQKNKGTPIYQHYLNWMQHEDAAAARTTNPD